MSQDQAEVVSGGIEKLLKRLKTEGVDEGKHERDKLIEDGQKKAAEIINQSKQTADKIIASAKTEATFIENAGKNALNMAARNAIVNLKHFFLDKFSEKLYESVSLEITNEDLLKKMILEVASEVDLTKEKNIEIILPKHIEDIEYLKNHPEKITKGVVAQFVSHQARSLLKEGVTFKVSNSSKNGISFRLKDKDIQMDLDDNTISDILLKYLQPRFKALLDASFTK